MRRVVITGLGVVSALGVGREAHFAGLREGRCAIGPLQITDIERLSVTIAAQARDFVSEAYFSKGEIALLDRTTQMALIAAREAMADAGLTVDTALAPRAGTVIGTALNGMETIDQNYRTVFLEMKNRVHPFIVPRLMTNAGASQISMAHGLKGPAYTVTTACSSSNHAMGQAFDLIRHGRADVVVTGGAEAPMTFGVMKAWEGLRVMSKDGCRPFCATRNGMVQGEGAAIFVFEERERALARGARIWGEVVGFGMSADAGDIVTPSVDGAARAIRGALDDAGMSPGEIDYINAHGTATTANDRTESAAIIEVFGDAARDVAVSSTKSMHGHCIGGAGAVEMVAVLLALTEQLIPPTVGFTTPDPECPLDITPNVARARRVDAALTNSFAFGGLNAVLALRRA
jgi:nodulation protein E